MFLYRVNAEGAVLVGDFGLARDVYAADYYRSSASNKLPVKWMPPETLNDGISNEKTDVVSHVIVWANNTVHILHKASLVRRLTSAC